VTTLAAVQRWFQAAITHPEGVRHGVGSTDAAAVLTRSNALGPLDRLAVYANAYFARLLDCLREEYPVVRHALGGETFDAFAAAYLQEHPSRSYTLFALGAKFPDFLRATRPAAEGDGSPDWADFLIDLADLELLFNTVFDGPGVEGKPAFDVAELAAVEPDRLLDGRFEPVPCLRLTALRFPAHAYLSAVRRKEEPTPPDPADTYLAVTRARYVVRHYELSRPAYRLLSELASGNTLGGALAAATAEADAPSEADLGEWFRDWAARGFFRSVSVPPR
jgi:hypothetical protein